ncbi:MAG: hypothetical protein E2585_15560 [Comamonas sp.]|nr:hypothetical protein [Comamonas sp.]
MVLSRAAFIPLNLVEALEDLSPLASALQEPWTQGDSLEPIVIESNEIGGLRNAPPKLTEQIAASLSRSSQRPVVVVGQEGFDAAMLELWARVPPEFRKSLTFGMSFGPDDVHELAVVCTPKELGARWDPGCYVDQSGRDDLVCSHTATLLNLPKKASFRDFAKRMQLSLDSPMGISIAIQALELWQTGSKPSEYIQLLRILAERAGSSAERTAVVAEFLKRLGDAESSWTEQDVLLLRNLELTASPGATFIAHCLTHWVSKQRPSAFSQGLASILSSWATEKAKPAWLTSVGQGFEANLAAKEAEDSSFEVLWAGLTTCPNHITRVLSLVDKTAAMEKRLLSTMADKFPEPLANTLASEMASRGWWTLAGALLARSRTASQSLKSALELAPSNTTAKHKLLESSLGMCTDTEAVLLSVGSRDATAIDVVSDACIRQPAVFKHFDWTDSAWFRVLKNALTKSASIVDALPNPTIGVGLTITHRIADDMVWWAISMCSLANLIDVERRSDAWTLIPQRYAGAVKSATADGWLSQYENGTFSLSLLEPELAEVVVQKVHAHGFLVDVLRRAPSALPRYLTDFIFESDAKAAQFLALVRDSGLRLDETAAYTFGRIALNNRWRTTAHVAKDSFNSRSDFHPFLKECLALFDYFDQLFVAYRLNIQLRLSTDEAWQAFEAEAVVRYPEGPWERELWSRSGGRPEDLIREQSGKASWHRCLRELRVGMRPGVSALLNEMLEDFSNSDALRQLQREKFWI